MTDRTVPRIASWLGYLGLIPFLACAVGLWLAPGRLHGLILYSLLTYSVIILAFLGAVHWGLAMREGGITAPQQLIVSVIPALTGWIALALPPTWGFTILIIAFGLQFVADVLATKRGLAPSWYPRLRAPLTIGVILSLLVSVALL